MALSIRDPATDAAVRELARLRKKGLTETVREAVENELQHARKEARQEKPLIERITELQERLARYPQTGLKADKAFFDELEDEF